MSYLRKLGSAEVSTSSMADIAFLLLTFFLMTTVIKNEKGLMLMLPQWTDIQITSDVNEINIFSIQINAENSFLIEGERRNSMRGVKEELKRFILNNGAVNTLSETPQAAVVSLKTDRSTSHEAFIQSLDEIQGAYFEIYAERANISIKKFRELDLNDQDEKKIYDKAREGIPMNISVAEPSHFKNH
jgi:biopolymer transport protein ExbD